MKFLVLGATGFLGSHVVGVLTEAGHEVIALSRTGGNVGPVPVRAIDVFDTERLAEAAAGVDGAFLCTGKVSRNPEAGEELHRLHVRGTDVALRTLRSSGVRRVVVASTSGTIAVGTSATTIHDERDRGALEHIASFPYYRSKYYGERAALELQGADFEVIVANPSLLLGPGDLRESSTSDVRKFLERSIPATPAGGIAFVDVRDAARGLVQAFEKGRAGERYLLNAVNLTVAAFFSRLTRLTGVSPPPLRLPKQKQLALGLFGLYEKGVRAIGGEPPIDAASVEMGQLYWYCSSEKAERELGFRARDPNETLRDTVWDLVNRRVVVGSRLPRFSATE